LTRNSNSDLSGHTVIAVDVIDVTRARIFIDASVIERRCVIDPVPINANSKDAQIGCGRIHRPRNGNRFCAANGSCADATGRKHGVGHASCVAIEHDVFDYADLFALSGFHFRPDKFACLHVTAGARRCAGLGLSLNLSNNWSSSHTQDGKCCSEYD
jgi:hypothetical protein